MCLEFIRPQNYHMMDDANVAFFLHLAPKNNEMAFFCHECNFLCVSNRFVYADQYI